MTDTSDQAAQVVELEERTWLARHCRGDQRAFPALLQAYRRPVYSYLVRAGVAAAERDDVFQSIFLKIHAAAPSYDAARPLAPWLFTIVANTVRNHLRDRRRRERLLGGRFLREERAGGDVVSIVPTPPAADSNGVGDRPVPVLDAVDPRPDPERTAAARETLTWLERAIRALPAAQREVLLLGAVAGLRQQDIAEALDLPRNTVKTHLRRARLTLTAGLAEREARSTLAQDTMGDTPGEDS